MRIKAVILDFDGVIYNSSKLDSASKIIFQIIRNYGRKIPRDVYKKLKNNWGLNGPRFIEICFGLDPKIAKEIYREWEWMNKKNPYPLVLGSKQVIKRLKLRQIKVLLLTNRRKENLTKLLNYFKLIALFDFIQAEDDWSFSKPDPHAFCLVLHQLAKSEICPEECVYAGDTILDFECTMARGLTSVSVLTGVFNESDFIKAGQKKENIIRSITDLPEWIEKYNQDFHA